MNKWSIEIDSEEVGVRRIRPPPPLNTHDSNEDSLVHTGDLQADETSLVMLSTRTPISTATRCSTPHLNQNEKIMNFRRRSLSHSTSAPNLKVVLPYFEIVHPPELSTPSSKRGSSSPYSSNASPRSSETGSSYSSYSPATSRSRKFDFSRPYQSSPAVYGLQRPVPSRVPVSPKEGVVGPEVEPISPRSGQHGGSQPDSSISPSFAKSATYRHHDGHQEHGHRHQHR